MIAQATTALPRPRTTPARHHPDGGSGAGVAHLRLAKPPASRRANHRHGTAGPPRVSSGPAGGAVTRLAGQRERAVLTRWVRTQRINMIRHADSLRAFGRDEFGTSPAAPSAAHVDAVNAFIGLFRSRLQEGARWVDAAATMAEREPTSARLRVLLDRKDRVGVSVLYAEGIWDFYFDLFVQRLSAFGERLRAVDRIAANCYEDLYIGIGSAQPTPRLLPFTYAASGFGPATYRRGVPIRRLRHHPNLFPLIMLPQHRLDNPWAMSSVLHEVSHNLQADLKMWDIMPGLLHRRLTSEGISEQVAAIWAIWHKEVTADMYALVLGGPPAVESLMDVVGRSARPTLTFTAIGVHPTPYLRVFISLILLRRMGFPAQAAALDRVWRHLYPEGGRGSIPAPLLTTFDAAAESVVDTIVFRPHPQFGGKSLIQAVPFGPDQLAILKTAGRRLAQGQDPGSVPLRLMIGAARFALDQQLASPQAITDNFYRILGRR
jgi:hypothetical protein